MEPTDEELFEQMKYDMTQAVMPVTAFVGIETVLGFFGNILIIYVFTFRYHVCNFRYFVLCMATLDLTSCLTTMPGEILTQTYWFDYKWNYLCKVKSFFNVFTVTGVAFCLLVISVDRYRKVCCPFGWQIKPRVSKLLCPVIYVGALIVALPCPILWGVQTDEKLYKNRTFTATICETDEVYKDTNTPKHYTYGVYVILSISLFVMFVMYVFVARKLFRDKRKYYGTSTKMATFMNSTYLAGASSDILDSSTKPESSDTGHALGSKDKKPAFKLNVDDDHSTDDTTHSHEGDRHKEKNEKHKPHQNTPKKKKTRRRSRKSLDRREMAARVRRKTLIMFILTIVFIITTIMYITFLSFIADGILPTLSNGEKAIYFFFFRFYFVNHVINPLIYGIMDPHFRRVLMARFETQSTVSITVPSGRRH